MSKGLMRSAFGALTITASLIGLYEAKTYEDMTPNDIADRRITDDHRAKTNALQQALTQKTGPVYEEAAKNCAEEESKYWGARIGSPLTAAAVDGALGSRKPFNKESCIDSELDGKRLFTTALPAKGQATEKYKQDIITGVNNFSYAMGGIGAAFLAFGAMARRRSRLEAPDYDDSNTPSGPNTPALG